MNQEEKRFFEVEDYLRNELKPEAAARFEADMAADPALAQQVATQRALQRMDDLFIEDDLRASVKAWQSELDEEQPKVPAAAKSVQRWPLLGLLGLAALVISGIWFWSRQPAEPPTAPPPANTQQQPETPIATDSETEKTPEQQSPPQQPEAPKQDKDKQRQDPSQGNQYLALASRFEEAPTYAGGDVRAGGTPANAFEQAMESLGKKDFSQALSLFKGIPAGDEHWMDAQYNLGCLLYSQKKHAQAVPFLQAAANEPDFLYGDNARWHLTLCLLATGKPQAAKAQLELLVAQPKGDFYKKALDLEKELK